MPPSYCILQVPVALLGSGLEGDGRTFGIRMSRYFAYVNVATHTTISENFYSVHGNTPA